MDERQEMINLTELLDIPHLPTMPIPVFDRIVEATIRMPKLNVEPHNG